MEKPDERLGEGLLVPGMGVSNKAVRELTAQVAAALDEKNCHRVCLVHLFTHALQHPANSPIPHVGVGMGVGRIKTTMIVSSQNRIDEKTISTGGANEFGERLRQPFLIVGQRWTGVPEAAKPLDR
jgi:hypothetical protein